MNEEFFATVYNKALDIVSRREHSEKEIKNKLLEKFDAPEIIEQVVLKLIENTLLLRFYDKQRVSTQTPQKMNCRGLELVTHLILCFFISLHTFD